MPSRLAGLLCAGAAALALPAHAQFANFKLYGTLNLDLEFIRGAQVDGPNPTVNRLSSNSSRFGIRGVDYIGGGLAVIYLVNAVSFLAVLFALATMRVSGKPSPRAGGSAAPHPIADLREGLRFVFTTPLIVWTMVVDFFATFFSGAMSLLPIFADQVLHVGASGYGFLVSAPAVGSLAGSLALSVRPLPERQGRIFLWAVAAYGAATVAFGFSRNFSLTLLALAATGAADAISTVIRQTLRQIVTPDVLRGRMTSVNMIFFMGGPQLGELEAGVVASLFSSAAVGVTVSVVSGGLATLVVAGIVAAAAPVVRAYDFRAARKGG